MVKAGDVLENPTTGDRLVFRKTAADTNGEAVEYEVTFRPSGFATREHLHPRQEERHQVVEGTLRLVVAGQEQVLQAGDSAVVPPNTPHHMVRADAPVTLVMESRPALDTEALLETFVALGQQGKLDAEGNPSFIQLAVIAREFEDEGYPTKPPLALQRLLLAPLAALGRRRGYRARASASVTGAAQANRSQT